MVTALSTQNKEITSKDLHAPKQTKKSSFLKNTCWSFSCVSSTSIPEKHGSFSES